MALLEDFPLPGFGNDAFLHGLGDGRGVLLDLVEQFAAGKVFVVVDFETDRFNEFEVVPVDVALLRLLCCLLLLAPCLLLLGAVKVEHLLASLHDALSPRIANPSFHFLRGHLEYGGIGTDYSQKICVVFGS
jgi:hypothetical protein